MSLPDLHVDRMRGDHAIPKLKELEKCWPSPCAKFNPNVPFVDSISCICGLAIFTTFLQSLPRHPKILAAEIFLILNFSLTALTRFAQPRSFTEVFADFYVASAFSGMTTGPVDVDPFAHLKVLVLDFVGKVRYLGRGYVEVSFW